MISQAIVLFNGKYSKACKIKYSFYAYFTVIQISDQIM